MKRLFLSFLLLLLTLSLFPISYATPPLPISPACSPSLKGIIPLGENNLEVTHRKYELNLDSNTIKDTYLEGQAQVRETYEIYNPGDYQQIDFGLPFLSKYQYIPYEFSVKVNGEPIDTKLKFAWGEYYYDMYIENYQTTFSDYPFQNNLNGYLYQLVIPKLTSNNSLAKIDYIFYNVPINTIFLDAPQMTFERVRENDNIYKYRVEYHSEEVVSFFISEDLQVDTTANEYYDGKHLGQLEAITITKEPISLKDYIRRFHVDGKVSIYPDTYERLFYLYFDETLKYNYSLDWYFVDLAESYHLFSLEFSTLFLPKSKNTIEITYDIPIGVKLSRNSSKMTLNFVNEYNNRWGSISDTEIIITSTEPLLESNLDYEQIKNVYQILLDKDIHIRYVTFNNSKHKLVGCGLSYDIVSLTCFLGFMFTAALFTRRTKK